MGAWLNLELIDSVGTALVERPFELHWSNGQVEGGVTDARGRLALPVPPGVERAVLFFQHKRFELELGTLPPLEALEGVQERLNHLNFHAGRVDGVLGPRTRAALAAFQRACGLPDTGELDAATRARLAARFEGGEG